MHLTLVASTTMYPQTYRLTNSNHIGRVLTQGRKVNTPLFRLICQDNIPEIQTPQIAVIISKKKLRKATDRNKAKRRFRHAITPFLNQIQPHRYVFLLNPQIINIPYSELVDQIQKALSKTNNFKYSQ